MLGEIPCYRIHISKNNIKYVWQLVLIKFSGKLCYTLERQTDRQTETDIYRHTDRHTRRHRDKEQKRIKLISINYLGFCSVRDRHVTMRPRTHTTPRQHQHILNRHPTSRPRRPITLDLSRTHTKNHSSNTEHRDLSDHQSTDGPPAPAKQKPTQSVLCVPQCQSLSPKVPTAPIAHT